MKIRSQILSILFMIIFTSCQVTPQISNMTGMITNTSKATMTVMLETNSNPTEMETLTSLPTQQTITTGTEVYSGFTKRRNVTYCGTDELQLKADLYIPINTDKTRSLIIFIHGGGWTSGDKRSDANFMKVDPLMQAGFAVASINYRLAPEYKMADMIADVRCAVRSFRAHAAEYEIDPDRIGVWGESAGAQLAALLGTMDGTFSKYDHIEYESFSSKVQVVVDLFGPSDLISLYSDGRNINLGPTTVSIFGSDDIYDPIYTDASPVNHISPDDPPFLMVHGNADETVPLSQSQQFHTKLVASGVDAQLVVVKRGNHGLTREEEVPSREEIMKMIIGFLIEKLLK